MSESANLPFNFGGVDAETSDFENAKVLIWPVPFEKTVSYGGGTKDGPHAIIEASRNMELFDEEIGGETADIGIHTLPPIDADREVNEMMQALYDETKRLMRTNKFICMLGGEHSISSPVIKAHHEAYPNLSVLQIDAHADLRDEYDGTPYSHASIMRRVVEFCPAVQVGIRSLSAEEARVIPSLPTKVFYAKDIIGRTDWIDDAVDNLTEDVYLTIDVDGFDPSLIPTTGTPEPGGLGWYEVVWLIKKAAEKRRIVGMDVTELSTQPGNNAPSFLTAKLIYKTLGYIFADQVPKLVSS
ncbi:MAG TPA: agmatinase [Pyrinomonadaceae bacterium]|nr:agmatinase [Pyrinomonadaceae bacterium]